MTEIGRLLVIIGLVVAVIGLAMWGLGRMGFRGLPGDIRYESHNVRIYIPIVSMLLLSLLLTAVVWLWQWISRR